MLYFLLPPSEWKTPGWIESPESLSFSFEKPIDIGKNATEKDLKCKGSRYTEGVELNTHINTPTILSAIERYTGVMYNAIDHSGMSSEAQKYFNDRFLIMSGMYGIIKPRDTIGNYKLPIETKGLVVYWREIITTELNKLCNPEDIIIDLLPLSYKKMINWKELDCQVKVIDFYHTDNPEKKFTHGVKWVKWRWIKQVCETESEDLEEIIRMDFEEAEVR